MRKTTVTTYACELCGWTSYDEAEAVECEERCTEMKARLQIYYPVGTFLVRDGYLSVVSRGPVGDPKGSWSISLNMIQSVHDRNYLFSSWDKEYTELAMSGLKVIAPEDVPAYLRQGKHCT